MSQRPMRSRLRFLFTVAGGIIFLAGCQPQKPAETDKPTEKQGAAMPQEVTIKMGELGPDFAARYPGEVKVVHQPAGLDFYGVDWDSRSAGTVKLEHGRYALSIEHVLSLSTSQSLGPLRHEGFTDFNINSGITEPDLISHDEARVKTYAMLRRLLDQGWKSRFHLDDPRLLGKERLAHVLNVTDSIGLDPSYVPTFEEWMNIPTRTGWKLYADRVFLDISFTRERTLTDPAKPGSYLLTFNIESETEHFRGYVESEDRLRWKELLPAILPKLAAIRAQRETELKAKGVAIDESYRDPPVPALK